MLFNSGLFRPAGRGLGEDSLERRVGKFAGSEPFAILHRWLDEARQVEPNDPDAIALATVDCSGMPNVRMVLLRGIEDDSFVFYTNYASAKARELNHCGKAAFVMHWKSLRRQVRARGHVERAEGDAADSYFASRSLESRHGAWASRQSQPLESRRQLMSRVAEVTAELGSNPKRPPFWGGFRLRPIEIEFWSDGESRLHDRFQWKRESTDSKWSVTRLSP